MSNRRNFIIAILLFLFITAGSFILLQEPKSLLGRAANRELDPTKSIVVGWPLKLSADGSEASEIQVFLLSNDEKPVTGKTVSGQTTLGKLNPASVISDANGQAAFKLSSIVSGPAQVSFTADSLPLSQTLQILFE